MPAALSSTISSTRVLLPRRELLPDLLILEAKYPGRETAQLLFLHQTQFRLETARVLEEQPLISPAIRIIREGHLVSILPTHRCVRSLGEVRAPTPRDRFTP